MPRWPLELAMPLLERFGYAAHFDEIKQQAAENGFWLLLIAGFTPIPFKVFTLASGAVGMPLLPFFFGALIGRGKRVFLVAAAIRLGGARAEALLRKHVEPIGWLALLCATCEGTHTVSPSPRLMKALPPRWRESMCSTVARKP